MGQEPPLDILIKNGYLITLDDEGTRIPDADLGILDGMIVSMGKDLQQKSKRVINANGNAVMPGLVNCHMHETLERGLVEDLPLMRWLEEVCFPIDRAFQPYHQRAAALMSQLEMIRGGTTTFIDIYRYPEEAALVAEQSGLRAILSPQIIDEPAGAGETLESNIQFIETWKDKVPGRIFAWFGPHAPYTVRPETYQRIADLAGKYQTGIHTHLCEVRSEVDQILKTYGKTPVEYLDELGVLQRRFLGAHGVHLSDRDIQLLAERGAAIAYNPSSNMKLASGVAPVPDMIAAGVKVGLGTDSNLSNNNLDMFEEMRLAAMLQKLTRNDPEALPVEQVLRMATSRAADCLGLGEQIGSLEIGKRADIILLDLHAAHMWPIIPEPESNVYEQIVYSANAGDVVTTIVDGKVLMLEREFFTLDKDEAEVMVHEAVLDLLSKAGIS
jgi:5-methylthioadenosine/S-adenosylhomocysteine deaminase